MVAFGLTEQDKIIMGRKDRLLRARVRHDRIG